MLLEGIYSVIGLDLLRVFDVDEIEFFLCGENKIDINDWKLNTKYRGNLSEKSQIIKWFWKIVSELDEAKKRKFLQFCTGCSRVPAEGFGALQSNNGKVCRFCIEPRKVTNKEEAFIIAHTCFNRIELPLYKDFDTMQKNIHGILDSPQLGFGIE